MRRKKPSCAGKRPRQVLSRLDASYIKICPHGGPQACQGAFLFLHGNLQKLYDALQNGTVALMRLALAAHHPLLSAFCAKPPVIEHVLLHYALKPGIGGKVKMAAVFFFDNTVDPHVPREAVQPVITEQHYTICHLCPHAGHGKQGRLQGSILCLA